MVNIAGVGGNADPGSLPCGIACDCRPTQFTRALDFEIAVQCRGCDFKPSSPKSRVSYLKRAREQQQSPEWHKQNGHAWIVFEMPYTG
jgi:glutaredoxin